MYFGSWFSIRPILIQIFRATILNRLNGHSNRKVSYTLMKVMSHVKRHASNTTCL